MKPDEIQYEVIHGEGKDPSLLVETGGRKVPLHSRRNPRREADLLRDEFEKARGGAVIVLGVGLGYHLVPLSEMADEFSAIILVDILKGVGKHVGSEPSSFFPENIPVHVFSGFSLDELEQNLAESIDLEKVGRINVVEHPASMRLFSIYYDGVKRIIRRIIDRKAANVITRGAFDRSYLRNSLKSLDRIGSLRPVRGLFSAGAGSDALLVSSGPSLEMLLSACGSEPLPFLIAVDSALPVLQKYKIEPDCIVSIDPQPYIMEHLRKDASTDTMFVGVLSGYAGLWSRTEGSAAFLSLNSHPLAQLLEELYPGIIGSIDSRTGTVAGDALMLAFGMGFERIAVAGLDFSFPRYRIYARGSAYQERFASFLNSRFMPVESLNSRYVRQGKRPVREEGIPSRRAFLQYRESLGRLVEESGGGEVIQVRGEGLSLPGCRVVEIDEIITSFKNNQKMSRGGSFTSSDFLKKVSPLQEQCDLTLLWDILGQGEVRGRLLEASLEGVNPHVMEKGDRFFRRILSVYRGL